MIRSLSYFGLLYSLFHTSLSVLNLFTSFTTQDALPSYIYSQNDSTLYQIDLRDLVEEIDITILCSHISTWYKSRCWNSIRSCNKATSNPSDRLLVRIHPPFDFTSTSYFSTISTPPLRKDLLFCIQDHHHHHIRGLMDPYIFKLSPVAIAVPTLSFFTLVIDAPSFAWHIKNRNLAASCLVFWVMLNNLFNFIDSIIWHNDNIATWWHGEVYCDIQVKLFLASQLGLTGSAASVMRSLAIALNTERMVLRASTAQRHRKLALDLLLCFGLPLYMIVIHYIIQPSRYYIIAIAGCTPSFQSTWPAFLLAYIWPLLSCLLAGYYSGTNVHLSPRTCH